nr:PREDICTED: wall-associated receptor kinase 2-like [Daucus carota subsp. sativus]XP_017233377.1 PREDICTED: wall-associated receptor kinase 2-like [Daucus carota subsp. sativus]
MAQHLLLCMMLALLVFAFEASGQERSLAKPGCQQRCGSLIVSYPFGIGANFSADTKFKIHCNGSFNPPKAFLEDNNLEVLQISPGGTIQVNNPVLSKCGNGSNVQQVMASGSFTFSDTENRFTALGCETLGVLTQQGFNVGGVRSREQVPAVLDWRLPNRSCTYQKAVFVDENGDKIEQCMEKENTLCTDEGLCSCAEGYEGNPYLPNGCQERRIFLAHYQTITYSQISCGDNSFHLPFHGKCKSDNTFQCQMSMSVQIIRATTVSKYVTMCKEATTAHAEMVG